MTSPAHPQPESDEPSLVDRFWWQPCFVVESVVRRVVCKALGHQVHTEYRCAEDHYGETWCVRCGDQEPMFTEEDRKEQITSPFWPIIEWYEEKKYEWKRK